MHRLHERNKNRLENLCGPLTGFLSYMPLLLILSMVDSKC